ncbi:MAG TPA: hypothetical protein VGU63_05510 [Candidatus Acidoferrales bacterium]|nr:hypothetical protein [Candidatus Acidoferrales bacterium]
MSKPRRALCQQAGAALVKRAEEKPHQFKPKDVAMASKTRRWVGLNFLDRDKKSQNSN